MSIKLVVDMNLSVEWVAELVQNGWTAVHWSTIGDPRAKDTEIVAWALANDYVIFTHDLDFGALLALTYAKGPSILQIRGQNVLPEHMSSLVMLALKQYDGALATGALVVVDANKTRVRVLPLR